MKTIKYKVNKLSFIKKNTGVTISPGIYRVFDYPKEVWEYLKTLPGILEIIEEDSQFTMKVEKSEKVSLPIKVEFEETGDGPGLSINLEKPIENKSKSRRKINDSTN